MATSEDGRTTESGIEIEPVYTADDVAGLELEPPGEYPFTRGPYPTMYRGRPWTIRQYAGFGSADETNERFRYLLDRGQTGISIAFDLPTQLGYDSDDPLAAGEVGRTGVAIDSIEDMRDRPRGLPLDRVSTSMTINAPASLLLLLYELVAEEQGVTGTELRGTVQNDILKEYIARGNYIFPPRPSMRSRPICSPTVRSGCRAGTRSRSPATTSARPARRRSRRSPSPSRTASPTAVRPSTRGCRRTSSASGSPSSSTRTTTSSRRWRSTARPGGSGPGSCTSGSARRTRARWRFASMPRQAARPSRHSSPRTTSCAWRSRRSRPRCGGAQSLHTNGFDEALALPTERSATDRAPHAAGAPVRGGDDATVDPLGGSLYIESLTTEIEERSLELIDRIEELGGAVAAVEQGFVQTRDRGGGVPLLAADRVRASAWSWA